MLRFEHAAVFCCTASGHERAALAAMHGHSGQSRPGDPWKKRQPNVSVTPHAAENSRSIQSMNLLPLQCLWHTAAGNEVAYDRGKRCENDRETDISGLRDRTDDDRKCMGA